MPTIWCNVGEHFVRTRKGAIEELTSSGHIFVCARCMSVVEAEYGSLTQSYVRSGKGFGQLVWDEAMGVLE